MLESSSEYDSSSNKDLNEVSDDISDNDLKSQSDNLSKNRLKNKPISKNPKKKIKKDKMKKFLNYFEAFKEKEHYLNTQREEILKMDFEIEQYSNILSNIDKDYQKELKALSSEKSIENINQINEGNLFELITEIIKINGNVFLYGLGSKLSLIYEYIQYFQDNINNKEGNGEYYFLIFNLYNQELVLKRVFSTIIDYLLELMTRKINDKIIQLKTIKPTSPSDQIGVIEEYILILRNNFFKGRFIIILNNIDGPNFQNRAEQNYLSYLSKNDINIIATCDNVNIVNLWTQEIKTRFNFYYLKFNTMIPYSIEINHTNSLTSEKSIKNGFGLTEIFESFSQNQKELLKELANLQLKGDFEHMTPKGLVDYFIDEGLGICNNQSKLNELILEAKDHDIVSLKLSNKINKEIYKFEIEKRFIEKISNGEFIFDKY